MHTPPLKMEENRPSGSLEGDDQISPGQAPSKRKFSSTITGESNRARPGRSVRAAQAAHTLSLSPLPIGLPSSSAATFPYNAEPQECAETYISFEDHLALRADLDKAHYHVSPNAGLGKAYFSPCFKTSCYPSSMVPSPRLGYLGFLPAAPTDGIQASISHSNEPLVREVISVKRLQFSPEPERAHRSRDVSSRSQHEVAGVRGLPSVSAAAGSAPEPVGALLGHGILAQAQRAVAPEPVRAPGGHGFSA